MTDPDSDGFDDKAPKRAMREEVLRARQAIASVRPVNLQIGGWQMTVARLNGTADRFLLKGGSDAGQSAEAAALRQTIAMRQVQFLEEVALLPPNLRTHGRIDDTLKALDSVLAAATRAETLLAAAERSRG